jgi:hypothetical protein
MFRTITMLFLSMAVFLPATLVSAQSSSELVESRRQILERTLSILDAEIKVQEDILRAQQGRSVSLERDLAIINAKITKTKLSIKAINIAIEDLSQEIGQKGSLINALSLKLARERDSLAQIIRKTNQIDSFSLPEIVLGRDSLSQFFADLDSFQEIRKNLEESFKVLEDSKNKTAEEKDLLEERREEEVALRRAQELEKRRQEVQESEKKTILKISRGLEAEYQKLLKSKEQSAAQIRSELFTLRGSAAIPFEKAHRYALVASQKTSVRPALILGIIAEESNLGENVGTGNWRVDMKSPRDTLPFLDITSRLGLDPDKMPVSKKAWYGFGGAMGPAQFIPSTWVLFESRIAKATGHNPPNPWDPEDAFMAAALLLMDNGADKGTYSAERLAALRYFAGWANAKKSSFAFYGDDVMDLAEKYQRQIDILDK